MWGRQIVHHFIRKGFTLAQVRKFEKMVRKMIELIKVKGKYWPKQNCLRMTGKIFNSLRTDCFLNCFHRPPLANCSSESSESALDSIAKNTFGVNNVAFLSCVKTSYDKVGVFFRHPWLFCKSHFHLLQVKACIFLTITLIKSNLSHHYKC